jgi:hypothetical protein
VHGALTEDAVALQRAVRGFAASLKGGGIPVERTLALLFNCIADTKLTPLKRERLVRTREHFVRWVLDAYYSAGRRAECGAARPRAQTIT